MNLPYNVREDFIIYFELRKILFLFIKKYDNHSCKKRTYFGLVVSSEYLEKILSDLLYNNYDFNFYSLDRGYLSFSNN